jgi:hypothetical protein
MIADETLLHFKYEDVIDTFAKQKCLPLRDVLGLFYKSLIYKEMSGGISDMHCRSDEYLAEELHRETSGISNEMPQVRAAQIPPA